jgi:Rab3 GTPase-activating protein catalytic subunit
MRVLQIKKLILLTIFFFWFFIILPLSPSCFWALVVYGLFLIPQILHYLETLQPNQLLEEMVCTAFRASADTLNQTSYGGLKQMATKLEQLYITMASSLRPLQGIPCLSLSSILLQLHASLKVSEWGEGERVLGFTFTVIMCIAANRLSAGSEIIDDLRQLCGVLEHVEKLLTVASSLHRKFLQAPRLSEAIFSDYYNFYLPRMGTASVGDNAQMVKFL